MIKVEDSKDYFTDFDRRFLEILAVNLSISIKMSCFIQTEPITFEKIIGTKIFQIILNEEG